MSSTAVVYRHLDGVAVSGHVEVRDRSVRRRVGLTWGLMVLNTMGYTGLLVHVPSAFGKLITQGALPLALVVALTVNRRLVIRPNVFLCLVTVMTLGAVVACLHPQYFGTYYRTFRLAEFVAVLWLLTPFWGRRDLLLVRCHLISMAVILVSVAAGVLVSPGKALGTGRLVGAIWDIPAPRVAHYSAVAFGVTVVFWLCGQLRGRRALVIVVLSGGLLLATHTRTALLAMVAALIVSGLSLIAVRARVRRLFAIIGAVTAVAVMTLSSFLVTWLARGEGTQELFNLTGRTKVWGPLLSEQRDRFQEIFGFGISNDSFNGLPIDSNWLASYLEQGFYGVICCAVIIVFLLVAAYFAPRGLPRALALFFITYCLVASFTEVGFTGASPYLLELTLAASLLAPLTRSPTAVPRS